MKVFCKGFNLYRQLNECALVIKEFTRVFNFEVIKQVFLNHSYSVILTNKECLVYLQDGCVNLASIWENDNPIIASNDDNIFFVDGRKYLRYIGLEDMLDIKWTKYEELLSEKDFFTNIICGSKLTVISTKNGVLYKIIEKVPHMMNFKSDTIVDIKCGKEHSLLLDTQGNVYSFGRGSRGQLGHESLEDLSEPVLIEALAGIRIMKIATGGWHSCAISHSGDLYIWGWNSNGQLGLGIEPESIGFTATMATPTVIDFPEDFLRGLHVSCGSRHTTILLDDKQLYGCGWNKYNQLTKDDRENYFSLTHLHNFENETVVDLKCGPWNSAVLCL